MSLPIYQRVAVTDAGDVIPGAEYTVVNENTGVAAPIYSDRTGATLLTAPYFADSAGTIQFFIAQGTTFRVAASGGVGTYTDRYVYGVAGAVLTDASGSVDDGGSNPLTISRNGGTDANTSIRFSQLSNEWYVGANGSNVFGINTNPDLSNALFHITPAGNVGIGTSSPDELLSLDGGNIKLTNNASGESKIYFTHSPSADRRAYIGALETDGNGNSLIFASNANGTDGVERVRIDSEGRVGVGIATPTEAFEVAKGKILVAQSPEAKAIGYFATFAAAQSEECLQISVDGHKLITTGGYFTPSSLKFHIGDTERMRIDGGGRLLVGTTTAPPFGNVNFGGSFYADAAIGDESSGVYFGLSGVYPSVGGSLSDNQIDLGNAAYRWDDVYATNGTIQTSDRNEKQDILEITAAETAVATACKGLLRSFRWKDSVAEKGDDARVHFGIIAQDLQDAFTAEGLDAGRYAMFISGTSWETQTEVAAVEAVDEVTDKDGNVTTEAVEAKDAYTRTDTFEALAEAPEGATERTRLGVRYSELLAFIIAAI